MNQEIYRGIGIIPRGSVHDVPALNRQFPSSLWARRAIDCALTPRPSQGPTMPITESMRYATRVAIKKIAWHTAQGSGKRAEDARKHCAELGIDPDAPLPAQIAE